MRPSPPTDVALRALVRAALRFRDAAPWNALESMQPFGVRDPQSGRVLLALVNGSDGSQVGLSMYPGTDGFITMRRIIHGLLPQLDEEVLHGVRSVLCGLTRRTELSPRDRQLLRDVGYDSEQGALVPQFRSLLPGFVPWTLDAEETRQLTHVLDQSLEVANDLGRNPRLFDDAPQYSYLTRRAPTDSAADRRPYEWAHADLEFGPCTRVPAPDEVTAARISRLPINADVEWEVALVAGAGALQEDPRDRPELMLTLLVVDRESTFVLHGEPLRASTALEAIQPAFAGLLLRTGFAPRRILVRNPAQRDQLAPIAKLAGSRLLRVQRLPSLEEVSDDLKALMRGQPVQP